MSVFSVQSKVQVTKETTETIMKDHGKKWSQHISHLINAGFSPVCTTENKCLRKFGMEDCNWAILTEGAFNPKEVHLKRVFAIKVARYFQEIRNIHHRRKETGSGERLWGWGHLTNCQLRLKGLETITCLKESERTTCPLKKYRTMRAIARHLEMRRTSSEERYKQVPRRFLPPYSVPRGGFIC